MKTSHSIPWKILMHTISGDVATDKTNQIMYATDSSLFYIKPRAVVFPKDEKDVIATIKFANKYGISITARTAGTSLAGQAIGSGIILDMSRYMNQILKISPEERWVEVEPGVNLEHLNNTLKPMGLLFGPETSTASRCCIGGMLGNNSCGLHSLVMGSVRDHIDRIDCIMEDGSKIRFKELTYDQLIKKTHGPNRVESRIYHSIDKIIHAPRFAESVSTHFPDPILKRRNMGYALDQIYHEQKRTYNISRLIAGSEGTLAIATKIRIHLQPQYPKNRTLLVIAFDSLQDALCANLEILKHKPIAIELMDHYIVDAVKKLNKYDLNHYFPKTPQAVLMAEFVDDQSTALDNLCHDAIHNINKQYPSALFSQYKKAEEIQTLWNIRKDGLGVLANIKSKKRSTTVIEDTAVAPKHLPAYIDDLNILFDRLGLNCVFYAHIATGELHLRPMLDLEDHHDKELFLTLAKEVALLVKKYRGSLSGEHGDGRLRSPMLPYMFSKEVIAWFKNIKRAFDPHGLFNPNVILNADPDFNHLKYNLKEPIPSLPTYYRYDNSINFHDQIDKCTGSGICIRKDKNYQGMCPTYHATKQEEYSTRGRSNLMRATLRTNEVQWNIDKELLKTITHCLGCKACKRECPSSVDVAKLKSEYLAQYYEKHRPTLQTLAIAYLPQLAILASKLPRTSNFFAQSFITKKMLQIASNTAMPRFANKTARSKMDRHPAPHSNPDVILYVDEFTNYFDSELGYKAFLLLLKLGCNIKPIFLSQNGRTYISKGLLKQAKKIADKNVSWILSEISPNTPILGIEPSTTATLVDEYMDLIDNPSDFKPYIANIDLIDHYLLNIISKNPSLLKSTQKTDRNIYYHGHCHQKASFGIDKTVALLSMFTNGIVETSKTACCGMAGSFGYEKAHATLAIQVGEVKLFPDVRKRIENTTFIASGTSCRHHIAQNTGATVLHPIEWLYHIMER
ncbi:FAD-binding oxidoreductase [Halosquirtibacter laminarini]|uniref:FAD-binding oxidoreductase n=1 Tax=Halosquirtibacter laminarini TaxID=3374600 RepID=A0AC61NQ11_9BACT|nr:FAD-binding oxidoreductase [Prolixibacteraceae bacterium]